MSKYRVEFKSSRVRLIFQMITYVMLVLSVLSWQADIIQYQLLLQVLLVSIISIFVCKAIFYNWQLTLVPVVFSVHGEWLENNTDEQVSWKITNRSRVSPFLLFIHLISPVNTRQSKWCLIYKDQVTERDYRRLCCAIIYQQQSAGNINL